MKEFLDVSLFGGAVLSLVAYEIGLILKKKFKMAVFNRCDLCYCSTGSWKYQL